MGTEAAERYTAFVADAGSRLRQALVAAYGPEVGAEATAEALAYGWEHLERIIEMENPAGYLYRVGQSKARRYRRRPVRLPPVPDTHQPWVEPGLVPALTRLSDKQRVVVLLCHGYGWTRAEVADLLGVNASTVQRHLDRAMPKLRRHLGAADA